MLTHTSPVELQRLAEQGREPVVLIECRFFGSCGES